MNKKIFSIVAIILVSSVLFSKPLFSNQPLGLDALGHLSKVSYLKMYPFANWDMSWYSGTLFLKLYSPLFYYLTALFSNTFFAANFLCFLSVILTSLGIYFFVRYKTKNEKASLFCGLGYLSVLSLSYYWISTSNLPYFFALWTIPFSLYFLEKSLMEKQKKYFVFYSLIFLIGILAHVVVGFLIGILMIARILFEGIDIGNFKRVFFYGIVPVLLASFWFVPFLAYSNLLENYKGYAPSIQFLFGFDKCCWGLQAGGIGVLFFLFIPVLLAFFFKKLWKKRFLIFLLSALSVFGFLLFGGLGGYYPFGVDAFRFILPFSILLTIFVGLVLNEIRLPQNKVFLILILSILIFGLVWNFSIINKNFNEYSYCKEESRYKIMQEVINNSKFPIKNEFTNHRFGTSRYVFGETINFFMPNVAHNLGYQDVGMLYPDAHQDFIKTIWQSEDINKSVYLLDSFGIRYFEGTNSDSIKKFEKDSRFKVIGTFTPAGYDFILFEYLNAKHIIALVDYVNDVSFGREKEFSWERKNPDIVTVRYNSVDEDDAVLFKEFYHKTWKAKELESEKELEIHKNSIGFMFVNPSLDSRGVIFYQSKTFEDYLGIILSLLGIVILIICPLKKFC